MSQPNPQAQQQAQMESVYQATVQAIRNYQRNPAAFTDQHLNAMKKAADMFGIPFEVRFSGKRAFKKGAYELGEGLTLGLLPDSWDPGAMNAGESVAGAAGGLLGLATPAGLAFKGASAGIKLARGIQAGTAAQRQSTLLKCATRILENDSLPVKARAKAADMLMGGEKLASKMLKSPRMKSVAEFALKHPNYARAAIGGPIFLATQNMLAGGPDEEEVIEPDMMQQQ